jgi:hypothetical protein
MPNTDKKFRPTIQTLKAEVKPLLHGSSRQEMKYNN